MISDLNLSVPNIFAPGVKVLHYLFYVLFIYILNIILLFDMTNFTRNGMENYVMYNRCFRPDKKYIIEKKI